jgi:hypothetical protein
MSFLTQEVTDLKVTEEGLLSPPCYQPTTYKLKALPLVGFISRKDQLLSLRSARMHPIGCHHDSMHTAAIYARKALVHMDRRGLTRVTRRSRRAQDVHDPRAHEQIIGDMEGPEQREVVEPLEVRLQARHTQAQAQA